MNKRKLHYEVRKQQFKNMKIDSAFPEGYVNYISVPSLESIATINIVVSMWEQPEMLDLLQGYISKFNSKTKYDISDKKSYFKEMEEKVWEKLSIQGVPSYLKTQVFNVIRPIGLQLLDWIDCEKNDYFDLHHSISYVNSICWTKEGIIDKAKTLELQFGEKKRVPEYHAFTLYGLACSYCSENFIIYLWKRMSKETKEYVKIRIAHTEELDNLIIFWTCFVENELPEFLIIVNPDDPLNVYNWKYSLYQNIFTYSVTVGNVLAVKYFWSYLTFEEKISYIEKLIDTAVILRKNCEQCEFQKTNKYTDILCFLLSQVTDKEQQKSIFKKHTDVILECLLMDWPVQRFILPTMRIMWDFLKGEQFIKILSKVAC